MLVNKVIYIRCLRSRSHEVPQPNLKTKMFLIVSWKLRVSRIDTEALADCSMVLVWLQRSYDRLVSSSCVAPRTSERWQSIVVYTLLTLLANLHLSCKYVGASPCEIWYINTASLKSIRRLTGNQWSCLRTGVMCSCLPVRVSSRAAAFWTDCSFLSRVSVMPQRAALFIYICSLLFLMLVIFAQLGGIFSEFRVA